MKISWIGPWVSRIDWSQGHWCGSTYKVVRMSVISSKTGKNVFLGCFWAYVGQPHDHTSWATPMPFASINPTNPRTNPWNFHEKILRIGGPGKWGFFEAAILNFLSRTFWNFFCFISLKNPALLYEVSFFSALWMVFPESWKRSCPNFYAHDCIIIFIFYIAVWFLYLVYCTNGKNKIHTYILFSGNSIATTCLGDSGVSKESKKQSIRAFCPDLYM